MPQTTESMPVACAKVWISTSTTCAAWTEVSGSSNSVTTSAQTRNVGEGNTFEGEAPIVKGGKKGGIDVTVRIMFTPNAAEAFRLAREAFRGTGCNGNICVRWVPGGEVGDDGFQTEYSVISSFKWPDIDAAGSGPIFTEFTVRAADIDPFVYVS